MYLASYEKEEGSKTLVDVPNTSSPDQGAGKGTHLTTRRWLSPEDLMHSTEIIVNNTVL